MNLSKYLQRIGFEGTPKVDFETLKALQNTHMQRVPFENLDIHYDTYIEINLEKFYDKVVHQGRGGFCFELNGLFNWALKEIGFEVTMLSAAVVREDGTYGLELGHLTNMVQLDGQRWMVDVGFGDSFPDPLAFVMDQVQVQKERWYQFSQLGENRYQYAVSEDEGASYKHWWNFSLTPRQLSDFPSACHYMQTSPETHFTHKRVCSVATPEGRLTLSDLTLRTRIGKEQTIEELADEEAFLQVLRERFHITLHKPHKPPLVQK
ncbi:MAG TPA: acetyltransferase [Microscillaceae bacterium]|nr:acetyltransferase [Microscillaceae bacterium]